MNWRKITDYLALAATIILVALTVWYFYCAYYGRPIT